MRAVREMKAGLFQALANPTRIHIVELLASAAAQETGEMPVSELLNQTGVGAANLSQHLAVLRGKGLVTSRKVGSQVSCRLRDDRIGEVLALMKVICATELRRSLETITAELE